MIRIKWCVSGIAVTKTKIVIRDDDTARIVNTRPDNVGFEFTSGAKPVGCVAISPKRAAVRLWKLADIHRYASLPAKPNHRQLQSQSQPV
jgi:hypothetical protein